jgi:hypothetical protein
VAGGWTQWAHACAVRVVRAVTHNSCSHLITTPGAHTQDWASCIMEQASSGELDQPAAAAAAAGGGGGTRAPSSLGGSIGGSTAGLVPPSTPRRPLLHPEAWQQQQQQVVEMQPLGAFCGLQGAGAWLCEARVCTFIPHSTP